MACLLCAPRARAEAQLPPDASPDAAAVDGPVAPAAAESAAPAPAEGAPLRPWRFTGTLAALSLPRPLSLELLARFRRKGDPRWDLFAVGAGIEYLPSGLAAFTDKTALSWLTVGADARWFPWRWTFVGARIGYQYVRVDSEKFGSEVDYTSSAFLLAPKIGVLHSFASGLTLGLEMGAGIPLGADTTLYSDGTQDSNARKVMKTFGTYTIPFVSLRIGYTL